jgi:hypothetical protein
VNRTTLIAHQRADPELFSIYAKDVEVEPRDVLRVYFATSLSGELGWQFEKIRMFAGKLDWNPSTGDKNVELWCQ